MVHEETRPLAVPLSRSGAGISLDSNTLGAHSYHSSSHVAIDNGTPMFTTTCSNNTAESYTAANLINETE